MYRVRDRIVDLKDDIKAMEVMADIVDKLNDELDVQDDDDSEEYSNTLWYNSEDEQYDYVIHYSRGSDGFTIECIFEGSAVSVTVNFWMTSTPIQRELKYPALEMDVDALVLSISSELSQEGLL